MFLLQMLGELIKALEAAFQEHLVTLGQRSHIGQALSLVHIIAAEAGMSIPVVRCHWQPVLMIDLQPLLKQLLSDDRFALVQSRYFWPMLVAPPNPCKKTFSK